MKSLPKDELLQLTRRDKINIFFLKLRACVDPFYFWWHTNKGNLRHVEEMIYKHIYCKREPIVSYKIDVKRLVDVNYATIGSFQFQFDPNVLRMTMYKPNLSSLSVNENNDLFAGYRPSKWFLLATVRHIRFQQKYREKINKQEQARRVNKLKDRVEEHFLNKMVEEEL